MLLEDLIEYSKGHLSYKKLIYEPMGGLALTLHFLLLNMIFAALCFPAIYVYFTYGNQLWLLLVLALFAAAGMSVVSGYFQKLLLRKNPLLKASKSQTLVKAAHFYRKTLLIQFLKEKHSFTRQKVTDLMSAIGPRTIGMGQPKLLFIGIFSALFVGGTVSFFAEELRRLGTFPERFNTYLSCISLLAAVIALVFVVTPWITGFYDLWNRESIKMKYLHTLLQEILPDAEESSSKC